MTTTAPLSTPHRARPWPRNGIEKLFSPSGNASNVWFVPSASVPGAFRLVRFYGDHWTCSCPAGEARTWMGWHYARNCSHVSKVVAADQADGYAPRPTAPANVSAVVD